MRSLIILSLAFTSMATYLEKVARPSPLAVEPPRISKVIRDPQPVIKPDIQVLVKTPKPTYSKTELTRTTTIPLNLNIPFFKNTYQFYQVPKTSTLNLLKRSKKPEITYNAELVYDIEKGENITGGKVNIRIPLT